MPDSPGFSFTKVVVLLGAAAGAASFLLLLRPSWKMWAVLLAIVIVLAGLGVIGVS